MKSQLYLVDAHAYLHRAYHALPPLTSPQGEPVGALYGFARMLLQLLKNEKPDAVAVCLDSPGPTFRHEAFAAYKATRKEIDEDLRSQLARAREMAEVMGFACAQLKGYEADDLMATLAKAGLEAGYEAVLVTGDKDALQLVGPKVRVLNVAKGVMLDAAAVGEKLGVGPSAVADFLALTGDASDNVPGVKGVGPVGAVKLLKAFGSVEGILKAARAQDPALPAKTAEALLKGEAQLRQALSLVRLQDSVPMELTPAQCKVAEPDPEKLKAAFERLGFRTLLKEMLGHESREGGTAQEEKEGAAVISVSEWSKLKAELLSAAAFNVVCLRNQDKDLAESSSALLAVGLEDGRFAVLTEDEARSERKALAGLLASKALKSVYDLKSASRALALLGLELSGPVFDVMLARYCLDPAAPRPQTPAEPRAALLALAGLSLGRGPLREQMKAAGVLKLYEEMELPLAEVLAGMEDRGVAIDEALLRTLSKEFAAEIASLQKEVDRLAGAVINVNSPKQLAVLLYDSLGLPVPHKTAKGGRSTDEEALRSLAASHPIPAKVLEFRELSKLESTYVQGLLQRLNPQTGRVHTRFDQAGTATGRLSSLDPNLQNIPIRSPAGQRIRRAFVAAKGHVLLSADYSQIDLRVLAHVSGDKILRRAFIEDEDVHALTACEVFRVPPEAVDKEMRRRAKAINFGIVYGQSAHGLSQQLGITRAEAADYIRHYFERYEGVAAWIQKNLETARREGLVRTWAGRVRALPELAAKNAALRGFGERAATNTPIQGGSADVIKAAMLRIHRGLGAGKFQARLLLQIHDELLFEVAPDELSDFAAWARREMEQAVSWETPLKVDVKTGPNWQDMSVWEREGRPRAGAAKAGGRA